MTKFLSIRLAAAMLLAAFGALTLASTAEARQRVATVSAAIRATNMVIASCSCCVVTLTQACVLDETAGKNIPEVSGNRILGES